MVNFTIGENGQISTLDCSNLESLKNNSDSPIRPDQLILPGNSRINCLKPGFILKDDPLALENFNQWLSKNTDNVEKLGVRFFCAPLNRDVSHQHRTVHLKLPTLKNLKELVVIDFDPSNTLKCTLTETETEPKPILIKSERVMQKYFSQQSIETDRFRIHHPSTEMFIPLPFPSFLLAIDEYSMRSIMVFITEISDLVALLRTCRISYNYYVRCGGHSMIAQFSNPFSWETLQELSIVPLPTCCLRFF